MHARSSLRFVTDTIFSATIFSVLVLNGCGILEGGADPISPSQEILPRDQAAGTESADHSIDGLLISYNRSTLGRTDYEQYRLVGDKLLWECGRISAGRYNPQTQRVSIVTPEKLALIKSFGAQIHRLVIEKRAKFATPGTTPEFFDPGQYTLTLEQRKTPATVKTTFDSVAIPQATREHLLNKLTLAVRGVVADQVPCGIKEFYLLAPAR